MMWLRVCRARVFALFHKERLEAEIDEELRFHIAMKTADNIRTGMPPAEASRAAQRSLGNSNSIKDACRDSTGAGALETLGQDLRYATRTLLKDGHFTVAAVIALALGIGANTALFTVLKDVLLRPLPYVESHRIMSIWSAGADETEIFSVSYPAFVNFRAHNRSFAQLGAYRSDSFALSAADRDPVQIQGAYITSDILPLLKIQPARGRGFTTADDEPGKGTAIISHELWRDHFDSATDIVDRRIVLDGRETPIIGVMPPRFRFPIQNDPAQIWLSFGDYRWPYPYAAAFYADRETWENFMVSGLPVIGRLLPGHTPAQAREDLAAIAREHSVTLPIAHQQQVSAAVTPWLNEVTNGVRPPLLLLIGAAVCVLALACVNVANLLLSRASTCEREIAIRSALGAGGRRILSQLLTQSLLLAAAGAIVGSVLALLGTRCLVAALPRDFPRAAEITPDLRVLAFTVAATVLASCFFGLAPAWRMARREFAPLLGDCSRSQTPCRRRVRRYLVAFELILAFVLLTAACWLVRAFWQLQTANPGFNPENLVTVNLALPEKGRGEDSAHATRFYHELLNRFASQEKVMAASGVHPAPLGRSQPVAPVAIIGRKISDDELPRAQAHVIAPAYFHTMHIPLLAGREFDRADRRDAKPVAIINQAFANRYFPGQDPLGKRIKPLLSDSGPPVEREIVAVVGDVKSNSLYAEQPLEVYLPHMQCASLELTVVIRTTEVPETIAAMLSKAASDLGGEVSIYNAGTANEHRAVAMAQPRLTSALLAAFAFVAISLTGIGIYGAIAYSVAQRRQEIGIRLALGAQRAKVFRLVLGEGLRLVGLSLLLGGAASWVATPLLRNLSYGAPGGGMSAIFFVGVFMSAVALLACWAPARRASSEDPLLAIARR